MPAEHLTDTELLKLMQDVKMLMGNEFSVRQAFDIAVTRAGWITRVSFSVFSSNVSEYASKNFPGAGQLSAVANWIRSRTPEVAGGVAWWRFQARLAGARIMGWLGPRAARRVVIRQVGKQAGKKGAAIIVGTLVTSGTVVLLIWAWNAYDLYKDLRETNQDAPPAGAEATLQSDESSGGFHKGDMARIDPRLASHERGHSPGGRELVQGNGVFLTSWWGDASRKAFCTIEAHPTNEAALAALRQMGNELFRDKPMILDSPTCKSAVSERKGIGTGVKDKTRDETLAWHAEIYRGRFLVLISSSDHQNITELEEPKIYMTRCKTLIDLRFPK